MTGGGGFIGRHVTLELLESGYDVRVLDNLVEQVHGSVRPDFPVGIEWFEGDVRDRATVDLALHNIDAVVHLAAEVGVGQSMYELARYVGANDLGTAVLLEAMIDKPIAQIVVASSMSVYGEGLYADAIGNLYGSIRRSGSSGPGHWNPLGPGGVDLLPVPTNEDKPVDLASIYALTKFAQERQVLIFGAAYRRHAVALRLFNVFGPGQALSNPYTGVLANFASRLASGEPPMIFEDGEQQRDFVHVRDVAHAFRLALEHPHAAGQVINIGSGQSYAIREVAELLATAMGVPELAPDIMNKARAGDIRNCFADIGKARELLEYEPRYRLEHSLDEIVAWVSTSQIVDRGPEMKRQLEQRGLVS